MSCRVWELRSAVETHQPTIFHFSGHGNENEICLENNRRRAETIRWEDLIDILRHQAQLDSCLVFLSSCSSASGGYRIANALGVEVIAFQGDCYQQPAAQFIKQFYIYLGSGRLFAEAFQATTAYGAYERTLIDPKCFKPRS